MTTTVADNTFTLTRYVSATKAAKDARDAARNLQAEEVVLRACGQWLDDKGEVVDLTEIAMPIRDVKSVWIEANVDGNWVKLRPNRDPNLSGSDLPKIEIEATFSK